MRNGTCGDGMVWLTTCHPFIIFSSASSCVWLVAGILLFLLHALRNPLVDGLQMLHIPDHCVVFIVSVIYYFTAECYWLLINYCTVKSFSQLQWVSLHVLFNRSTNWFLFCHYAEILTRSSWNDGIFACSVHQVMVASWFYVHFAQNILYVYTLLPCGWKYAYCYQLPYWPCCADCMTCSVKIFSIAAQL